VSPLQGVTRGGTPLATTVHSMH